jgi:5-formyltetrahydrofolate cyclo-ligase
MLTDIAAAKQAFRTESIARRAACDPADGATLKLHVLENAPPPPGAVVAGFWPLPGEIDIRPLLETLHGRGHEIVLPVTPARGEALTFRLWTPGAELVRERFGTVRPTGAEKRPDCLFVPLLAFDRAGRRLGYGGGYYDRTLAALPGAVAIGCAFAAQEVENVPVNPHDIPLHGVATERELIWCRAPV